MVANYQNHQRSIVGSLEFCGDFYNKKTNFDILEIQQCDEEGHE